MVARSDKVDRNFAVPSAGNPPRITIPGYTVSEPLGIDIIRSYRAVEDATGRRVVVKPASAAQRTPDQATRLRREYEILRALDCEGVPVALDMVAADGGGAIVFADIRGEPLLREAGAFPLGLDAFFSVALQLVEIVGTLHRHDIIHKDINPANIVIDRVAGRVMLADFGLASRLPRVHQAVVSPEVLEGTLAYHSPEQTGRMNRAVDYRSDFYSLGVTFYQLLTGTLPFSATDAMEMVHCQIARQPLAPHEVRLGIPKALSSILMKLLAKTAEDRYQSAYGLKADLEECQRQWRSAGRIESFPPGRGDVASKFRIPQKLYGRDPDIAMLEASFDGISAGAAELLLVTGPSGIGKSSLVNEVHRLIAQRSSRRGYFIRGKFDQYRRNIPYDALIQAFRELASQLLSESEESIVYWRRELLAALGPNGQVIVEVIPQIQGIIGPQPPVPALGPTETQNRFNTVFRSFIGVCARAEHPFTIFLDDLQWADAATVKFIQTLTTDSETHHILLIGAFRNQEVGVEDPVGQMISDLAASKAKHQTIELRPLAEEDVVHLVVDTVNCPVGDARALAELVHRKTSGTPFFVNQLLYSLYNERLIEFDPGSGRWHWDLGAIQRKQVTDNVVEFMVGKIRQLEPRTQSLLTLAANLGGSFDLATLAAASGLAAPAVAQGLFPVLQEGFIAPAGATRAVGDERAGAGVPVYEFQHDRIRQAAYSLISEEERELVHLQIGRLMLRTTDPGKRDELIFDIVNHLNAAAALIVDPAERQQLGCLNLRAGKKAAGSIAYETAATYFSQGLDLVGDTSESWGQHYELTFALQLNLAQALATTGRMDEACGLYRCVIDKARDAHDKATAYEQYATVLQSAGHAPEAFVEVRRGLGLFGIDFPPEPAQVAAATEELFAALTHPETIASFRNLGKARAVDELIDRLYDRCIISTYFTRPEELGLVISRNVKHVLDCGITPEAGVALSWFAMLLAMRRQERLSFEFAELALEVTENFDDPYFRGKSEMLAYSMSLGWRDPLDRIETGLEHAFTLCHAAGELQYASYSILTEYIATLVKGEDYQKILRTCERWRDYCAKYVPLELGQAEIRVQAHQRLMGLAENPVDPGHILGVYAAEKNVTDISESLIEMARVSMLFGDYDRAYQYCEHIAPMLAAGAAGSLLLNMLFRHVAAIVAARRYRIAAGAARDALGVEIEAHLEFLRVWAELTPRNFASYYMTARGEYAAARGDTTTAAADHLTALLHARQHRYTLLEAYANERLAELYDAQDLPAAQVHSQEAERLYVACHAAGKARALTAAWRAGSTASGPTPGQTPTQLLDLGTVIKASRAMSGEIVLTRLIERIMMILVENAGAERGTLLRAEAGRLTVVATVEHNRSALFEAMPLEEATFLPHAALNYVVRTGEPLVIDDAVGDGRFMHDPFVREHGVRSVLCAPLLNQGRLTGLVYLENNLAAGAFTPARLEMLRLLSAQAAISLENASLYATLTEANAKLEESNRTLEARVLERTHDLREARDAAEGAYSDLQAAQANLIQAEKMASLGQLTAGIAHEIKNPLNFVNNFARLSVELMEELKENSAPAWAALGEDRRAAIDETIETLTTNLQRIVEHGTRADNIVKSMLEHSRGSTGDRRTVDINGLIDDALNLAYHGVRARDHTFDITLERRFDEGLIPIELAPQEMTRVFLNLFGNGFYATTKRQRGGADQDFRPTLTVSTADVLDAVEIRVRDNGTGIAPESRDKLFQPFFTTKPAGEGTGLGLSISYDIVTQQHGGTIEVESEVGAFTEFTVRLPRRRGVTTTRGPRER
jgi:predicted ATPase/signal transduction histidine kinase/tRNA A-37 threonylcarbamoyl transferase component Bud32